MKKRMFVIFCLIGLIPVLSPIAAFAKNPSPGNTLIADTLNNRVIEVDTDGNIVWSLSAGLNYPRQAERLKNGNTLIADTKNNRAVEVNRRGDTVWQYNSITQVASCP
jgi:hypothetical protein